MAPLHPCPSCSRHVRADVPRCPFCEVAVDLRGVPARRVPPPGLSRGALLAFGAAALATSGCTTTPPADDAGPDAYFGALGDAYGAPDAGPHDANYGIGGDVYGAPPHDVGPPDAGSTDGGIFEQ